MIERNYPGHLIVLDGVGGSGKTTQGKQLAEYLITIGHEVVQTREPGGSEPAEAIRELIFALKRENLIDALQQALLFTTARMHWMRDVVLPELLGGKIVITDRSYTSTAAYQGFGEGGNLGKIEAFTKVVMGDIRPSGVILLDISPETAYVRDALRQNTNDPYDAQGQAYTRKIVEGYRHLAKVGWGGLDWYVVNGEHAPDIVTQDVILAAEKILKGKND